MVLSWTHVVRTWSVFFAEARSFLRFAAALFEHMFGEGSSERQQNLKEFLKPVNKANEIKAWSFLETRAQILLRAYPTTLQVHHHHQNLQPLNVILIQIIFYSSVVSHTFNFMIMSLFKFCDGQCHGRGGDDYMRELVFKGVRHFLFEFCHLLAKFFRMSESD